MREASLKLKIWILATLFIIVAAPICYLHVDLPLTLWAYANAQTPFILVLGKIVQFAFTFKLWAPVTVLTLVYLAWRSKSMVDFFQKNAAKLFLSLFTAMFFAGIIKTLLGRYRPELYLTQHLYGFHFFSTASSMTSMPSDHTTLIFTMVTFFSLHRSFWKAGFPLLLAGSILAFMRITYLRHYLSDVLVGAYLGYTSALLIDYFTTKITASYVR